MFLNRKIKFEYHIIKTLTAGMNLLGGEVSSLKNGKCDLSGSFCLFIGEELFMRNVHLGLDKKLMFTHDPDRDKKLLLTKKELKNLKEDLEFEKGRTIIISKIYRSTNGTFKADICLAKGKKDYDKKVAIKERDIDMDTKKTLKDY